MGEESLEKFLIMDKPYIINAEKLLVVSDIHQDIFYFKELLEREAGNYDHILLNGDFIDSHKNQTLIYGAKATAMFILELQEGKYGPCSFNLGNHDTPVMESWRFNRQFQHKHNLFNACSGFTSSKSMEVNKVFTWENWRKFHLFHRFGDYIISHAGIHPTFWSEHKTVEENLDLLWKETEEALELISVMPSKYLAAGYGRGGLSKYPGLTWQDWNTEFVCRLPLGQIVGHTGKHNCIRKINKSYCVDGHQSTYCILDINGPIEFKSIVQTPISKTWVEQKYDLLDMSIFYETE